MNTEHYKRIIQKNFPFHSIDIVLVFDQTIFNSICYIVLDDKLTKIKFTPIDTYEVYIPRTTTQDIINNVTKQINELLTNPLL